MLISTLILALKNANENAQINANSVFGIGSFIWHIL